jgi:hypothetical protein
LSLLLSWRNHSMGEFDLPLKGFSKREVNPIFYIPSFRLSWYSYPAWVSNRKLLFNVAIEPQSNLNNRRRQWIDISWSRCRISKLKSDVTLALYCSSSSLFFFSSSSLGSSDYFPNCFDITCFSSNFDRC